MSEHNQSDYHLSSPEANKEQSVNINHLSGSEDLSAAFTVRRGVFHDEQGISESDDFDGLDTEADHFVAFAGVTPIATARVRYIDGKAKVERVSTIKEYRGRGIGAEVMKNLISFLKQKGVKEVYLDSQSHAAKFYKKLGFNIEGDEFNEVGIPHVKMMAELSTMKNFKKS